MVCPGPFIALGCAMGIQHLCVPGNQRLARISRFAGGPMVAPQSKPMVARLAVYCGLSFVMGRYRPKAEVVHGNT